MATEPGTVERLDIVGQVCPASLLIALRRANDRKEEIRAGRVALVVLTDNRDSVGTITEAMENMGYRVVTRKEGDHYAVEVSAGGRSEG